MTQKEINVAINKSLKVLRQVTRELTRGTTEAELVRLVGDKYVIPGVGIRQHLRELQQGGCLKVKDGKLSFKEAWNPARFSKAA